jgi:hypothetical protein
MKPLLVSLTLPLVLFAVGGRARADDTAPNATASSPTTSTEAAVATEPKRTSTMDAQTVAALVGVGVGVVGFGLSAIYEADAISKKNSAQSVCPGSLYCATQEGVNRWSSAETSASVATFAFVVGCAGILEAAVFWFVPTSRSNDSVQVGVGPSGIRLRGTF